MENTKNMRNDYQYIVGDTRFLFHVGIFSTLPPKNNEMISHSHLYEEVIYIIDGEMEIQTDDSSVTLLSGDLAIIPANLIHHTCSKKLTHYTSVGCMIEKRKIIS